MTPDAAPLHWILWCGVSCGPVQPSIECICNVKMPDTGEAVCRAVSRCSRTVESHCGAAGIACHRRGESNVLQTVNCAYVIDVLPRQATVGGGCHDCIGTTSSATGYCTARHCEIGSTVIVDCNRRILKIRVSAGLAACVLNRTYAPRQSVIFRNDDGACATAAVIGQINCSVRCDFNVPM